MNAKLLKLLIVIAVIIIVPVLVGFALWYRGGSEVSHAYIDIATREVHELAPRLYYRGIKMFGQLSVLQV